MGTEGGVYWQGPDSAAQSEEKSEKPRKSRLKGGVGVLISPFPQAGLHRKASSAPVPSVSWTPDTSTLSTLCSAQVTCLSYLQCLARSRCSNVLLDEWMVGDSGVRTIHGTFDRWAIVPCTSSIKGVSSLLASPFEPLAVQLGFPHAGKSESACALRRPRAMALSPSSFSSGALPLVAVCQVTSTPDKQHNFKACAELVREAARLGACLAFLPEAFDFIARDPAETLHLSEPLGGSLLGEYTQLARYQGKGEGGSCFVGVSGLSDMRCQCPLPPGNVDSGCPWVASTSVAKTGSRLRKSTTVMCFWTARVRCHNSSLPLPRLFYLNNSPEFSTLSIRTSLFLAYELSPWNKRNRKLGF